MIKSKQSHGVGLTTAVFASVLALFTAASFLSCSGNSNPDAGAGGSGGSTGGNTGTAGSTGGSTGTGGAGGACAAGATRKDGVCMCSAGAPMICGAACVDPLTDNDHCGDCATACDATASCTKGKCGAKPTTFVPAAPGCGTIRLALSGPTLYWTESDTGLVKSMGTGAGGTLTTIAMAQMKPTLLGVFGTTLFWLDAGSKTIMKATPPTGTPAVVYTSPIDINGFTVSPDAGTVYFSTVKNISKVAATGGTPTIISTQNDGVPMALALEGSTIVFGSQMAQDIDAIYLADGTVSACGMKDAMDNGYCSNGLRLGRSQGSIFFESIFLIGGKVYWAHNFDLTVDGTMAGANDAAPQTQTITSSANFTPFTSLTITGQTAYFTENGYVESTPLIPNSDPTTLARAQKKPGGIAADANNLYWSTSDCTIMTMPVPKP